LLFNRGYRLLSIGIDDMGDGQFYWGTNSFDALCCNLQIWCGVVHAGFLEHLDLEILLVAFAGLYTRPVMELFGTWIDDVDDIKALMRFQQDRRLGCVIMECTEGNRYSKGVWKKLCGGRSCLKKPWCGRSLVWW
jgi:hypothetical protein